MKAPGIIVLVFVLGGCGGSDSVAQPKACSYMTEQIDCYQNQCADQGLADGAQCTAGRVGGCFGPDCCVTVNAKHADYEPCPKPTSTSCLHYKSQDLGSWCTMDHVCALDSKNFGKCTNDPNDGCCETTDIPQ